MKLEQYLDEKLENPTPIRFCDNPDCNQFHFYESYWKFLCPGRNNFTEKGIVFYLEGVEDKLENTLTGWALSVI